MIYPICFFMVCNWSLSWRKSMTVLAEVTDEIFGERHFAKQSKQKRIKVLCFIIIPREI